MTDDGFSFRLRFRLGSNVIRHDASTFDLGEAVGLGSRSIVLGTGHADVHISDARDLELVGHGFATEEEAKTAGREWQAALQTAFAADGIGADFGVRTASIGALTPEGFDLVFPTLDPEVPRKREYLGVHVYASGVRPKFAGFLEAEIDVVKPIDAIAGLVRAARRRRPDVGPKMQTAYAMYSAAATLRDPDARLLMFASAYEVLVEQRRVSTETQRHIDRLVALTEEADNLDPDEQRDLVDGLKRAKRQSISSAARDLADTLEGRVYEGVSARDALKHAYTRRSDLVHGNAPARDEVKRACVLFERLLRDLLGARLADVLARYAVDPEGREAWLRAIDELEPAGDASVG